MTQRLVLQFSLFHSSSLQGFLGREKNMADDDYARDEENIEDEEVDETVSSYQLYHEPLSEVKIHVLTQL
jgi:hypothetical protein